MRELLLGPQRFSDLRGRLDGISPSVLAVRLARVEALGLVRRAVMPAPAASTVYELTEAGEALRPAVYELIRWGGRLLEPPRKRDRVEPEWMRLALAAMARRRASPARRFVVHVTDGRKESVLHVAGGRGGTTVTVGTAPADATLALDVPTLLSIVSGRTALTDAVKRGAVQASGDRAALVEFADLFDPPTPRATSAPTRSSPAPPGRISSSPP